MNNLLLDHLSYLGEVNFATVPEFAEFCGTPNARDVLNSYIDAGYVVRVWRRNRGLYSLTDAGKAHLTELIEKQASKKNAKPDSSKQPDSKSNAGRNSGGSADQPDKRTTANTTGEK